MTKDDIKAGTNIIHKKGGKYCVIGIGTHTETGGTFVVYQSRTDDTIWIRPVDMFLEQGRFILRRRENPYLPYSEGLPFRVGDENQR